MSGTTLSSTQNKEGLRSGGYMAIRGDGRYNDYEVSEETFIPSEPNAGVPEYVGFPSGESLFKEKQLREFNTQYTRHGTKAPIIEEIIPNNKLVECKDFGKDWTENYVVAFNKSQQYGYRVRDYDPKNLFNGNFPSCPRDGSIPFQVDVSNAHTVDAELDAHVINEEYTTYKYGLQSKVPNAAKDLPGALVEALVKGQNTGPAVWTTKRYGFGNTGAAGYYAGYQSADANANGVVYAGLR